MIETIGQIGGEEYPGDLETVPDHTYARCSIRAKP